MRNHGGVPDIEEDAFELEIGGLVNKPVKLSMKELKDASRFPCVYYVQATGVSFVTDYLLLTDR